MQLLVSGKFAGKLNEPTSFFSSNHSTLQPPFSLPACYTYSLKHLEERFKKKKKEAYKATALAVLQTRQMSSYIYMSVQSRKDGDFSASIILFVPRRSY